MAVRYFFSSVGDYLGGFEGDDALALLPPEAVEVEAPPAHGLDRLVNGVIAPYVAPVPLAEQLEIIFLQALHAHEGLLPPEVEGDLFILKAGITEMLKFGRLAAARAKIENASIPEALEPIRTAMLEQFPL